MEFAWDPEKAQRNFQKHGVTFAEAATVFRDPLGVTVPDLDHSENEDRYLTVGLSNLSRLLIVAHTDRGGRIRIISARELTRREREAYEQER
ncbi:MAG: BrnT family toxin [Anaerolineae bacterium]